MNVTRSIRPETMRPLAPIRPDMIYKVRTRPRNRKPRPSAPLEVPARPPPVSLSLLDRSNHLCSEPHLLSSILGYPPMSCNLGGRCSVNLLRKVFSHRYPPPPPPRGGCRHYKWGRKPLSSHSYAIQFHGTHSVVLQGFSEKSKNRVKPPIFRAAYSMRVMRERAVCGLGRKNRKLSFM